VLKRVQTGHQGRKYQKYQNIKISNRTKKATVRDESDQTIKISKSQIIKQPMKLSKYQNIKGSKYQPNTKWLELNRIDNN